MTGAYSDSHSIQPYIWFMEAPSSPWAKQHRALPVLPRRNHIQTIWACFRRALEKGCLGHGPPFLARLRGSGRSVRFHEYMGCQMLKIMCEFVRKINTISQHNMYFYNPELLRKFKVLFSCAVYAGGWMIISHPTLYSTGILKQSIEVIGCCCWPPSCSLLR